MNSNNDPKIVKKAVKAAKTYFENAYLEKEIKSIIAKAYPNPSNETDEDEASSSTSSENIFVNELFSQAPDIRVLTTTGVKKILEIVKEVLNGEKPLPSRKSFKELFLEMSNSAVAVLQKTKQENEQPQQLSEQTQNSATSAISATSQIPSSTPVNESTFWQTASTADTANKKRELDATNTGQLDADAKTIEQANKRAATNLSRTSDDEEAGITDCPSSPR